MRRFLIRSVPLFIVFLLGGASSAEAGVEWKLLESTERGLRIRVTVEGERLREDPSGRVRVEIEGAGTVGEPGDPALPEAARWILLPPEGAARLRVLSSRTAPLDAADLVRVPSPRLEPEEGVLRPRLVEAAPVESEPSSFRLGIEEAVVLSAPVFQRGQRLSSLQLRPVLHDATTRTTEILREVEIEIVWPTWQGQVDLSVPPGGLRSGRVLNPEHAAKWRCLDPELRARRDRWSGRGTAIDSPAGSAKEVFVPEELLADEIRIASAVSGVVRVRVGDLVTDHGLDPSTPRRRLRVVHRRAGDPASSTYPTPQVFQVPIVFRGFPDENAPVVADDEILFRAFDAREDWTAALAGGAQPVPALPERADHYNGKNVYYLQVMDPGAGSWARMSREPIPPSTGGERSEFERVQVFTGDVGYQDDPADPFVERYHWNGPTERDVSRRIDLFHPVAGTDVVVNWTAGGHNDVPTADVSFFAVRDGSRRDLRTEIRLLDSGTLSPFAQTIPSTDTDIVRHGPFEFHMKREASDGIERAVGSFLGEVSVRYRAQYRASNDRIAFHTGETSASVPLLIRGFTRTDVLAFDVTDPRSPVAIELGATNFADAGDGTFDLRMQVPQPGGVRRSFVVSARTEIDRLRGTDLSRDPIRDLFAVLDDVQVLAIGPESLRAAMQPWIDWRRGHLEGRDWNVAYVDAQQVYDEFSGGLQSPWAIKALAEYAYLMWGLRALVLVGDASEDARGVTVEAGPNLVPPSLHLQSFDVSRELLASDKWYGIFGTNRLYPRGLNRTSDVLVGRLPVRNATDLQAAIAKIIAYEQPGAAEAWRQRTLWIADDAYSTDYLGSSAGTCYRYEALEEEFLRSQNRSANTVRASLDGTVSALVDSLDRYTRSCRQGVACESLSGVRQCFSNSFGGEFRSKFEQGWLIVSYQGHANFNVFAHESVFTGAQADFLAQTGRPFLFFGMGCHVSDFLQATEGQFGASIGERLWWRSGGGAIATYGSSGFEFLLPNARFMEILTESFFAAGRVTSPVLGDDVRGQWLLGDVLAAAEFDALGQSISRKDEMVSQYNLLGDPLLRMDAGPPRLSVLRGGQTLVSGAALVADAGATSAGLEVRSSDETGVARIEVLDDKGRDDSPAFVADGGTDPRRRNGTLTLPVRPQRYRVEVTVIESAFPELRRTVFALDIPLTIAVSVDGEPLADPADLVVPAADPVRLSLDFNTPVDIASEDVALRFEGVDLGPLSITGSGREWRVEVDAQARTGESAGEFALVLDGLETLVVEGEPGTGEGLAITRHVPYPNPARDHVRFVARATGAVDRLRLKVYDLSGRPVFDAQRPVSANSGADIVFEWDARDRTGSELANGTYLYRIEAEGPGGSTRSEMGRVVIVR